MNEEVIAAIDDYELALTIDGPVQAKNTLLSYSVELNGASAEDLEKILQIYFIYLERSPSCDVAGRYELKAFLANFLETYPENFTAQLEHSWQHSLVSVFLNAENASLDDHLAKIKTLQSFLPAAIKGAAALLHQGRVPCNDPRTLRTALQAAIFSTSLLTTDSQALNKDLERLLEMSFASYVHGATPLVLAELMQTCFEAAVDTIQAPATIQSVSQLNSEASKLYWKRAWTLLSSVQKISSTACDIFWGAYASTLLQLSSSLVSRRGPALSSLVNLLCNPDASGFILQCLLANPAAGGGGGGGGGGNLKSIKSAFKTAQTLLQDFPEAYVSACCDILTPAANAILATRIEAVNAIKLVIDHHNNQECYLWTQEALEKLLFALCRDPSVRLRRKTIELLQHVLQRPEIMAATEEKAVLTAVAQRSLDQDADVRRVAFSCLNSIKFTKLVGVLNISQWRRILEQGLEAGEGDVAAAKHAHEISFAAKRLFEKYLRQDEVRNEDDDDDGNIVAESKAVYRLSELCTSSTAVSPVLMATLAEILTGRDLTFCAI